MIEDSTQQQEAKAGNKALPWWMVALFTGLGLIFTIIGLAWGSSVRNFVTAAGHADGKIVRVETTTDSSNETFYYAVVLFKAPDGSMVEFTSRIGTGTQPELNRTVRVLFDPANPKDAMIDAFWSIWMLPLIFTGLGVILLAIGLLLWRFSGSAKLAVNDSNVDFILED